MRFIILMLVLSVAPATSCAPIALHCCIVGKMEDGDLVYSRTISEVNAIVADVNRIYEQVAMSFYVASVCMTNSSYFSSVSPNDTVKSKALCSILHDTGGVELYFIQEINENVTAFHEPEGVVISNLANSRTVAHELGHACGFMDIYNEDGTTMLTVRGKPTEARMPNDWGSYAPETTQAEIVQGLLMYGRPSNIKERIPRGDIYGLWYEWNQSSSGNGFIKRWHLSLAPIGMFTVGNRNPTSL